MSSQPSRSYPERGLRLTRKRCPCLVKKRRIKYLGCMDILFASGNVHKKEELESLLSPHSLHLPSEYGITFECAETGATFEENAMQKALSLAAAANGVWNGPILADDSGLLVDALPGELGVRTARFGEEEAERELTAREKNELLLSKLAEVEDPKKRSARFVCVLVLLQAGRVETFRGVAEGRILTEIHDGAGGFGYDPVFYCTEAGACFAEAGTEMKNRYSHRAKAAMEMKKRIGK